MTDPGAGNVNDPIDSAEDVAGTASFETPSFETPSFETPESIAEEVRDEIRLGHVEDDVSHVLEERFEEAGIQARPEEVDDLAEEIEKDVSS